jgi:hypothetical protein
MLCTRSSDRQPDKILTRFDRAGCWLLLRGGIVQRVQCMAMNLADVVSMFSHTLQ